MKTRPGGTVTFLFTDVEGSTALLKRLGRERYGPLLAEQQRMVREAFTAYGGEEVDTQGDSFFVAFHSASEAVAAAIAIDRALAEHSWPEGVDVRVRIGIHSGEVTGIANRYVGFSVHRAARIGAVAHGGQVLLSDATRALVEDELPPGFSLRSLGLYQLKDVDRPESIVQVEADGLQTDFPALRGARRVNMPVLRRRSLLAATVAGVLAAAVAIPVFALGAGSPVSTEVVPDSLVRIDPSTEKVKQVVPVGTAPDLLAESGRYIWVASHILRDTDSGETDNGGYHTLMRVDRTTGEAVVVAGVQPCGIAPDPSGDVWVANCYAPDTGERSDVIRVDAATMRFKKTIAVPGGGFYYRGITYGGGSLWLSNPSTSGLTQVEPETGAIETIPVAACCALAWSEGYGDLWMADFEGGKLVRVHPAPRAIKEVDSVTTNPTAVVADGSVVWVGDWSAPRVVRLPAVGPGKPLTVELPVRDPKKCPAYSCVWTVAAGAGAIWATTPRYDALWRIDPRTDKVTRINFPYPPAGVTADASDVWVTIGDAP